MKTSILILSLMGTLFSMCGHRNEDLRLNSYKTVIHCDEEYAKIKTTYNYRYIGDQPTWTLNERPSFFIYAENRYGIERFYYNFYLHPDSIYTSSLCNITADSIQAIDSIQNGILEELQTSLKNELNFKTTFQGKQMEVEISPYSLFSRRFLKGTLPFSYTWKEKKVENIKTTKVKIKSSHRQKTFERDGRKLIVFSPENVYSDGPENSATITFKAKLGQKLQFLQLPEDTTTRIRRLRYRNPEPIKQTTRKIVFEAYRQQPIFVEVVKASPKEIFDELWRKGLWIALVTLYLMMLWRLFPWRRKKSPPS